MFPKISIKSSLWTSSTVLTLVAITTIVVLLTECQAAADKAESYGLGDQYDWMSLEDGYEAAKNTERPLMLIIHKSWCGACKSLKPKFKESVLIHELSRQFIMVNTQDDDEPEGDVYQPDGGYIPRILFFDHEGELLKDIVNEDGNPNYKYYYSSDGPIAKSMKTVLKRYAAASDAKDEEEESDSKIAADKKNSSATEKSEL